MKKLLIGLSLIFASSAFAGEMPWKNEIHHYGWLQFDSCRAKMVQTIKYTDDETVKNDLQKAVDIIFEVRLAETDLKLQDFITDMNLPDDVTVTEVAKEVFRTDFYGDLCYDEIHGYGVLKHIVKSNLKK